MRKFELNEKPVVLFFVPLWKNFGHFSYPLAVPLVADYDVVFLNSTWTVYRETNFPDLTKKGIRSIGLCTLRTHSLVKALEKIRPDCVVVHDKGWPQERALLEAARYLGIPSLHIQHGIVADLGRQKTGGFVRRARSEFMKTIRTLRVYNTTLLDIGCMAWFQTLPFQIRLFLNPMDYCFNWRKQTVADKACIIGDRDRKYFIEKEGYNENQLVPFGAPQFERAYTMDVRPAESEMLLLLSQPLFEDHLLKGGMEAKRQHIREIVDASPVKVAVKPHPRESEQWYRDNFSSSELHVFPSKKDINEAIQECSHVIGYFSTALINALILRRPVGIIRWVDDKSYVLELDADGVASRLECPDALGAFRVCQAAACDTEFYGFDCRVIAVLRDTLRQLLEC